MTEDAAGSTNETTDSPQGPQHAAPQALQVGTWAPPTVATVLAVTLGLAAAPLGPRDPADARDGPGRCPEIGSFAFFVALWVTMMAARTLPGVAPAVLRGVRATGRLSAGARFVASYLAVWALVGVAVYPLHRPPGTLVVGRSRSLLGSTSSHRSNCAGLGPVTSSSGRTARGHRPRSRRGAPADAAGHPRCDRAVIGCRIRTGPSADCRLRGAHAHERRRHDGPRRGGGPSRRPGARPVPHQPCPKQYPNPPRPNSSSCNPAG
jgi:Predicted metal-binding integral membrane protein (DUF2182)